MPRGVYIARLDLDSPHLAGVANKISAQRAALDRAGFPTTLYAIRAGGVVCDSDVLRAPGMNALSRRMIHYHYFWRDTLASIVDAEFLYVRFQGAGPGLIRLLSNFRARRPNVPILIEIPTFPYRGERRGLRQHIFGFLDDICAPFLSRFVDRVVTFSERPEIYGIPTIATRNGVDVAGLPLVGLPDKRGPTRLVGVANLGKRHAYDRIISGLAEYVVKTGRRDVVFDVIGTGELEADLKRRSAELGMSDLVNFAGPLSGEALNVRLDGADIGIAALGMHRIAAETSDLKSREYCARGLPFITANQDGDFPLGTRHVLHVPADDTPVDISSLLKWSFDMSDKREIVRAELRNYAERYLTWDAKMAPVSKWLNKRWEQ